MAKKQLNIKASELTKSQLLQLCARWGTSQTETITVLIDRAARGNDHESALAKAPSEAEIANIGK